MYLVTTKYIKSTLDSLYFIDANIKLKQEFTLLVAEKLSEYIIFMNTDDISETEQIVTVLYKDYDSFKVSLDIINEKFPTFFIDRDEYCQKNSIVIERSEESLL